MRREELDYGNDSVKGFFRKLFFPTLAGMLFNALFLITDGIFVGRGIGPDALAAINLFAPLLVLFLGIGAMTGTGCSVRTSTRLSVSDTAGAAGLWFAVPVTEAIVSGLCLLTRKK